MFNLLPYNEVKEQFSNENGDPGILLAKATFKMHQKNVLVHALFRDPLRKPCRWFLPKIACFEPLKIQKRFIKMSIINPKLYKYYNLQQILKIRWKTKLENPSKRTTFVKNSPNSAHRLRIWLNFISVKWSRPPRSGSRSRAWTLSKMILFHAHFWTSEFAWNRIKGNKKNCRCVDRQTINTKYIL